MRALLDLSIASHLHSLNVANSGVVMRPVYTMLEKAGCCVLNFVTELPGAGEVGEAAPQELGRGVAGTQPVLSELLFSILRCCAGQE